MTFPGLFKDWSHFQVLLSPWHCQC